MRGSKGDGVIPSNLGAFTSKLDVGLRTPTPTGPPLLFGRLPFLGFLKAVTPKMRQRGLLSGTVK
jgi:hypothetical protein